MSDEGNNLYIDDINLDILPVGMEDVATPGNTLLVYPNPSQGEATVTLQLLTKQEGTLRVLDITGKLLTDLHTGILLAGLHSVRMDTSLPAGLYLIQWTGTEGKSVCRFSMTSPMSR